MQENLKFFISRYIIRWYTVPVEIQKLLLFIMQNTTKLYVVKIGSLIVASIEGFTKVNVKCDIQKII